MNIKNVLKQLGLNDRHTTIYLSCLELGSASIQKISEKSGFARSTCEVVLKSLSQKGFVTSFRNKKSRYFSPEDPKKLISTAQEKVKVLEEALPQFSARYFKGGVLPTVRLYQGEIGIKSVLREILSEATELVSFGSIDDIYDSLGDFFPKFTAERIKRKIPLRVILRDSIQAQKRQQLGPQQLREVRIIPETNEFSSVTFVWNNKVAMCSLKDGIVAFVVESGELANVQRTMFELVWQTIPSDR